MYVLNLQNIQFELKQKIMNFTACKIHIVYLLITHKPAIPTKMRKLYTYYIICIIIIQITNILLYLIIIIYII